MNITIIRVDGTVIIDGVSFGNLDLSFVPENVHALQWKNTQGWIEYVETPDGLKPSNLSIQETPEWVDQAVALWDKAKKDYEALFVPTEDTTQGQ